MSYGYSNAIFNQLDTNADGVLDQGEFKQWLSGSNWNSGWGSGLGYDSWLGAGSNAYNLGYTGYGGLYGGYYGYGAGSAAAAAAAAAAAGSAGSSYFLSGGQYYDSGAAAYGSAAYQQYAADASGNFIDSNPEIIRRPAAAGVQTYTQNVAVRFLQPPPVPPPGPLIIKEVRPPQPPPPAPLRLRQQAPPLPTPPPLVLRERPPNPPPVIPSQTVIRRLPAIPVPPRSVVIERIPPLPPKPRDILLERWLPYGPRPARRTLVQRAGPAVQYPPPRNVIVQYDPVQANVVRQVHNLGITAANPAAYYNTYGASLLDSVSFESAARSAGVVENISAPSVGYGFNAATYGQDLSGYSSWTGLANADWNAGAYGSTGYTYGSGYLGDAYGGWNSGVLSSVYDSSLYGGYGSFGSNYYGWNGGYTGLLGSTSYTQVL